jgi:hypothetical protein
MCDSGRAGDGGGKASEEPPRSSRRKPRLYPHTPLSEIISASPVVALHQARTSSLVAANCFRHRLIRTLPPVPSPRGLRGQGAAYMGCVLLR